MQGYDDAVLNCFLKNQGRLFPEEDVASSLEEAEAFLEECMAVVVDSAEEVQEYFEEEGIDMDGADLEELLEADEVFEVGDGRYLIVEGCKCRHGRRICGGMQEGDLQSVCRRPAYLFCFSRQ